MSIKDGDINNINVTPTFSNLLGESPMGIWHFASANRLEIVGCISSIPYWCVLRREFSGMIHWLTTKNHPSTPQQPIHSLRLAPVSL